jgi:hypothetical protein
MYRGCWSPDTNERLKAGVHGVDLLLQPHPLSLAACASYHGRARKGGTWHGFLDHLLKRRANLRRVLSRRRFHPCLPHANLLRGLSPDDASGQCEPTCWPEESLLTRAFFRGPGGPTYQPRAKSNPRAEKWP